MKSPDALSPQNPSANKPGGVNQEDFAKLYDQYAPVLFGVIVTMTGDKVEAARLLEITFIQVQLQFAQFTAGNVSLFVWLLSLARTTVLAATVTNKQPVAVELIEGAKVLPLPVRANPTKPVASPIVPPLNELLDAVLFKNCTPQEAASLAGLPEAMARQHLRQALQQMRAAGFAGPASLGQ